MKEKRDGLLFFILLLLGGLVCGCQDRAPNTALIRYASSPVSVELPVHYAHETKLYEQEGISLDLSLYPDGKSALESLLSGESDIASVMSTPVALYAFRDHGFKIIGGVDHGKFHTAIANKDSVGSFSPADWDDYTVGVSRHTSGEYFMYSYFALHEIAWDSMDIWYRNGPALRDCFLQDSIDVMFSWQPYINETVSRNCDPVVEFGESHLVPASWLIVCDSSFLQDNSSAVKAFLTGTKNGLEVSQKLKDSAIRAHQKVVSSAGYPALDIDPSLIDRLELSLNQELVLDLENQSQWLMDMDYVSSREMPDFTALICPDLLLDLNSHSLNLSTSYSCR